MSELQRLQRIVLAFADMDPDTSGDMCQYCGADYLSTVQGQQLEHEHKDDCIWLAAWHYKEWMKA